MKVFHSPLNQGLKEGCKFLNHAAFQAIKIKASIFPISSPKEGLAFVVGQPTADLVLPE